jgi:predicted component of type VI protein secretion system
MGQRLLQDLRYVLTFPRQIELELAMDAIEDHPWLIWCLGTIHTLRRSDRLQLVSILKVTNEKLTSTIGRQLEVIVRNPKFKRLETSWRGLHYLVAQVDPAANVRISASQMSKGELLRLCRQDRLARGGWQRMRTVCGASKLVDLHNEADWQDLPSVGGQPIGLLVVDHDFGLDMNDLIALEQMAAFGRRLQAPVIANLDCDATTPGSPLRAHQAVTVLRRLTAFRASDEARYLVLAAPSFSLARNACQRRTQPIMIDLPKRPEGLARVPAGQGRPLL